MQIGDKIFLLTKLRLSQKFQLVKDTNSLSKKQNK